MNKYNDGKYFPYVSNGTIQKTLHSSNYSNNRYLRTERALSFGFRLVVVLGAGCLIALSFC